MTMVGFNRIQTRLVVVISMSSLVTFTHALSQPRRLQPPASLSMSSDMPPSLSTQKLTTRRHWAAMVASTAATLVASSSVNADDDSNIFAPKFVQEYDDFQSLPNGVSYREVNAGRGVTAETGDRVVFSWSGYTIGYFGRPFQAKGGPVGGAFDKDLDYERTVLGSSKLVVGLETGLLGMQPGGVRQIVVPFTGKLSYPPDDLEHVRVGPKPSTFSGQRALNFVLENPRIDRTLLFNVKVVRVDKPDGKGGFLRG